MILELIMNDKIKTEDFQAFDECEAFVENCEAKKMPLDARALKTDTHILVRQTPKILRVTFVEGAEETLEDAKANIENQHRLVKNERYYCICDYRPIRSQTKDAQRYYASEEVAKTLLACAIIVESPLSKTITNFYMGLCKPETPTKIFGSEKEACEWVQSLIDEEPKKNGS